MTQKELKQEYHNELLKVWSEKMADYCTKTTGYVVEHKGRLYGIEKPRIQKDFCYGAGYCGISTEEEWDMADTLAEKARTEESFFKMENMKDLDEIIEELQGIKEAMARNWAKNNYPRDMVRTGAKYSGQPEDCKLNYFNFCRPYDLSKEQLNSVCWDIDFIDKLIEGYNQVKADFEKRLNTYLKRFGLSKVHSWSYLSD